MNKIIKSGLKKNAGCPIIGACYKGICKIWLKKALTVFVYHDVSNEPRQFSRMSDLNVPPDIFDAQINFIKENFKIISPDDLLKGDIPQKAALISFDDGFQSYFKEAIPILTKHKVPSIIFLNMEPIKGKVFWAGLITYLCSKLYSKSEDFQRHVKAFQKKWKFRIIKPLYLNCSRELVSSYLEKAVESFDEKILEFVGKFATIEDLAEADSNPLVFYGNHLFNHDVPKFLSDEELLNSYFENAKELKRYSSYRDMFAFPFGQPVISYSRDQADLLLKNNIKKVFSSSGRINQNAMSDYLHRISLNPLDDPPGEIRKKIICQNIKAWLKLIKWFLQMIAARRKMECIKIVPKSKAISLLPKIIGKQTICYYADEDYEYFLKLRDKFKNRVEIKNLSGLFQETFQEIRNPFLRMMADLGKKYNSFAWWGNKTASRNNASPSLTRNLTYLFSVKKILHNSFEDIVVIIDNSALSDCILNISTDIGYKSKTYFNKSDEFLQNVKYLVWFVLKIVYFFLMMFKLKKVASQLPKLSATKGGQIKKRIVIRSWVTESNFEGSGKFKDRNFGSLAEWLAKQNYEVWTLPTFFKLSKSLKNLYARIKKQNQLFLIPEHYLKLADYWEMFLNGLKIVRQPKDKVKLAGVDITPIFRAAIKEDSFPSSLLISSTCVFMLRRLKEAGFEIDTFYYSFENNVIEKQFILNCRKYFPNSLLGGFQHTTFFPDQLAYHLAPGEEKFHPLPDRIFCSGPIYTDLHKQAGFPAEIIVPGVNLRFAVVHKENIREQNISDDGKKNILLPLTFSPNLAFELFAKVKCALDGTDDYRVYIRTHPLFRMRHPLKFRLTHPLLSKKLSIKGIVSFLDNVGLSNYTLADNGLIQQWFSKMNVVITTGCSITVLEAVAAGVPVIRVVPDNTFFYDPFIWPDYPLAPVNTSLEVRKQLRLIDEILDNDQEVFLKIGKQVLAAYFTKPSEENLKLFL